MGMTPDLFRGRVATSLYIRVFRNKLSNSHIKCQLKYLLMKYLLMLEKLTNSVYNGREIQLSQNITKIKHWLV